MNTLVAERKISKRNGYLKKLFKNKALYIMILPGLIVLIINNYLPMINVLIAFKNFKFTSNNFFINLFTSEWIGFKNFEFFIKTQDAFLFTRNTIIYNLAFIALTLLTAVPAAIALNDLRNRKLAKLYQTSMFLPQFLSWVVVSYVVMAFLSTDTGFINKDILAPLGVEPVFWYSEPKYWPFILPIVNIWKNVGYYSIIYLAAITGIDTEMYEAAVIDGAGKWKQIVHITIPMLVPIMITMTLLQIGRIFFADFGLFFQVTQNAGALYPATMVVDTYVYNALKSMGDTGMSAAASLYQSIVGLIFILGSNFIVRKIDRNSAIF